MASACLSLASRTDLMPFVSRPRLPSSALSSTTFILSASSVVQGGGGSTGGARGEELERVVGGVWLVGGVGAEGSLALGGWLVGGVGAEGSFAWDGWESVLHLVEETSHASLAGTGTLPDLARAERRGRSMTTSRAEG